MMNDEIAGPVVDQSSPAPGLSYGVDKLLALVSFFLGKVVEWDAMLEKVLAPGHGFAAEEAGNLTGGRPQIFGVAVVVRKQLELRMPGMPDSGFGKVIRIVDSQDHFAAETQL